MLICEYKKCSKEHNGTYGSGRFCSATCARIFSTAAKRKEINEKVSKTLRGQKKPPNSHDFTNEDRSKGGRNSAIAREKHIQWRIENLPFESLPRLNIRARLLYEQEYKCAITTCDIGQEWNGKHLVLQLDHIDGKKKTDFDWRRENLRMICPNCHSQTKTFCSKNMTTKESKKRHKNGAAKGGSTKKGEKSGAFRYIFS